VSLERLPFSDPHIITSICVQANSSRGVVTSTNSSIRQVCHCSGSVGQVGLPARPDDNSLLPACHQAEVHVVRHLPKEQPQFPNETRLVNADSIKRHTLSQSIMSLLMSGSELSRRAPEHGSGAGGQDQYMADPSQESIRAAPCLPYVFPHLVNVSSLSD
jgi:hypothetical protein